MRQLGSNFPPLHRALSSPSPLCSIAISLDPTEFVESAAVRRVPTGRRDLAKLKSDVPASTSRTSPTVSRLTRHNSSERRSRPTNQSQLRLVGFKDEKRPTFRSHDCANRQWRCACAGRRRGRCVQTKTRSHRMFDVSRAPSQVRRRSSHLPELSQVQSPM